MANALQDQLLKAGLANKQKVRDVKTQKRRNRQQNVDDGSADLKRDIEQKRLAQADKDKSLNEKRFAEATEKGQVRSLITEFNRFAISVPHAAEIKFNFTLENKVYSVYLTDELQKQLLNAKLGIVRHDDKSFIVPFKLAERVNLLVPQWCGYLASLHEDVQQSDEYDPYSDYAIPDDLMW